ncbi:translation initiation factor IF-2 [Desulfosoma caldarium]|uniref:hypothetical protein n=1 Tax=Desulfosoma caldarium TaxID=610254 RepID=UPI0014731AF9|nr:hypothetical protein [Desulfosoma caldarium]
MPEHKAKKSSGKSKEKAIAKSPVQSTAQHPALEVVIKADTVGTCEALEAALGKIASEGRRIKIIHRGVGEVSKSDVLMAATASHLVLGLGVGLGPKVGMVARDMGVDILLSDVIHDLVAALAARVSPASEAASGPTTSGKILGQGTIIALFKSSRHGIIIGCHITEGMFRVGAPFRVISAMGPVYSGVIQSMQIDRKPVQEAVKGRQVGIKIPDWKGARLHDLVEVYEKS